MTGVPADAADRLSDFKHSLEHSLPGIVAKIVLFGSRARGDARSDSDYDLAVLLRDGSHKSIAAKSIVADQAFRHVVEGYALVPVVLPEDYLEPVQGHFRTELARRIARDGTVVR